MVRIICTIVNVLCGLFAVVRVAHIVMALGEANPANGVASFARGFSSSVSLAFGAVATTLFRRFALPNPRELIHQRRATGDAGVTSRIYRRMGSILR